MNEREKAGVPDAVLLEDFTNDEVFIQNLEKRFGENIIYVSRDVMARYRENPSENLSRFICRPTSVKC